MKYTYKTHISIHIKHSLDQVKDERHVQQHVNSDCAWAYYGASPNLDKVTAQHTHRTQFSYSPHSYYITYAT